MDSNSIIAQKKKGKIGKSLFPVLHNICYLVEGYDRERCLIYNIIVASTLGSLFGASGNPLLGHVDQIRAFSAFLVPFSTSL